MSHPLQSIIGTAQSPAANAGHLYEPGETKWFAEALSEEMRSEELAEIDIPRTETQETSEQSASAEHVETGLSTLPRLRRSPLCGGKYTEDDALAVLNSHFFIGKSNQETAIFRINNDGTIAFLPPEQFKLEIQNILVNVGTAKAPKLVAGDKFWKEHSRRHQKTLVFKPDGTTDPTEYNVWRGFGVEPIKGWQKQRRLLRHIREVICRRDRKKFKYLIRSLSWMVQNPERHSGVVIILKSRKQGTGKTTLGWVMLVIFGQHGALIDDKERLLGRFTDWLETISFALAEEITFAGDLKAADKLKSLVTGNTIQVERKYGSCRQIPNRLKIIATTNHDHAVAAGVQDRRNVVYDVSDERAGDRAWFDSLYRDLTDGGTSQFLHFLQSVKLGDWHPRQILKTDETTEQQRMSGDSVSHWSQACIEADAIIGDTSRGAPRHDLGQRVASEDLREAYTGFCKQQSLRPANQEVFGKACVEMFGPRKRLSSVALRATIQTAEDAGSPDEADTALDQGNGTLTPRPCPPARPDPANAAQEKRRPWGYDVPDGETWQEKIDGRLGIKR
jgi:hypothetical protein